VPELPELDGPLDVRERTRSELEVPVGRNAARDALLLDPALDPSDLPFPRLTDAAGHVPDRVDDGEELLPQLRVPGRDARTEQRLALPDLGPPLVVLGVGGQRPHEGAGPPLGPQVGVDGQDGLVGHGAEEVLDHAGDRERPVRHHGVVRAGQRVVHEQDVGVGGVADLAAAEAAHGHHEEAGRHRRQPLVPGDDLRGDADGGLEREVRHVRQLPPQLSGLGAQHVGECHARGLPAPDVAGASDGLVRVVLPLEQRVQLGGELTPGPRGQAGRRVEPLDGLRQQEQEVAGVP
jgi:hypothetical protein